MSECECDKSMTLTRPQGLINLIYVFVVFLLLVYRCSFALHCNDCIVMVLPCIVLYLNFIQAKKTAYISQSTDINQHAMPEKDTKG